MRITIVCNDTRGGVVPYAALALGLRDAGFKVTAVAPAAYADVFLDGGIRCVSLRNTSRDELVAAAKIAEQGTLASTRLAMREASRRIAGWVRDTLEGSEGSDVLLGGIGGSVIGRGVAEKLGVPWVDAHLQPIGAPTSDYPAVLFPRFPKLGGYGTVMAHHLSELALWMPFQRAVSRAHRDVLGIERITPACAGTPILYGLSPKVVPIAAGTVRPRHAAGYWTLPPSSSWEPAKSLAAFVAADRPLVSIGFGSMTSNSAAATLEMFRASAERAGVGAIVISDQLDEGPTSDDRAYVVRSIPHSWLFPRMHAVVHHGGAGTTGAAFIAGVPQIVVPFGVDQPFWASRVAALGVGPPAIGRKRLTAERLTDAICQTIATPSFATRARALGAEIAREDGVAAAVGVLCRYAEMPR